ncbi:MAG: cache domain-containing protein, partial [Armatimonadetes bacterium]|nr:cache domain-containing protein [Armatimonadota bacterium]
MSFNARLSWQTAIILSTTMLVVFAYTWNRAQAMVGELSGRIVRQTSLQIEQRIESLFERTEEHSSVLSGLASPSSQLDATRLDRSRFRGLASQMIELIKSNPEFSSMSIVLGSTGEYVQVVQRQNGSISADIITAQAGGARARRSYSRFGGRLVLSGFEAGWSRDPREDEGYLLASESLEQSWTRTRVIRTAGLPDTPGVTCATPITDLRGRLIGVASVDFTLTGLSRYLATIRVGETGYAFLAEMRETGVARIIAHPDPNRLLASEGGSVRLKTA